MSETNTSPVVEVRYSSYTPAQKRATQKYRSENRDKVNEQRKRYYQNRKENDPAFIEYKRSKAKEYYQKAKELKQQSAIVEPRQDAQEPEPIISAIQYTEPVPVVDLPVIVPEPPKPTKVKILKRVKPTIEPVV